jgi:hypothetical protein
MIPSCKTYTQTFVSYPVHRARQLLCTHEYRNDLSSASNVVMMLQFFMVVVVMVMVPVFTSTSDVLLCGRRETDTDVAGTDEAGGTAS